MYLKIKKITSILRSRKQTIAFMESCSGGFVSNAFTNIKGASDIFKFSAITYSEAFKIKMGVNAQTIDKYTVYSPQTAREMARAISVYAHSEYGIGITGQLDFKNKNDNIVYVSIYYRPDNLYYDQLIKVFKKDRVKNKKTVLKKIITRLLKLIMIDK